MTRSAVAASAVAALLLAGCGHAVRDSVKTSGEAAERAVREWERSQSALVLAEDARTAVRDAAAAAADLTQRVTKPRSTPATPSTGARPKRAMPRTGSLSATSTG